MIHLSRVERHLDIVFVATPRATTYFHSSWAHPVTGYILQMDPLIVVP